MTDFGVFKLDLAGALKRAQRQFKGRVGDVTLNLPFLSLSVSPQDRERKAAREIMIRMKDRRVLSRRECCDNCIDSSLGSLEKVRALLVDKQVELADLQDGPLFLLADLMSQGIRQFMTYAELLEGGPAPRHSPFGDFRRPPDTRQAYFDALELLRGHLSRCLGQVAVIGGMEGPSEGLVTDYIGPWEIVAYVPLSITDLSTE